MTTTAVMTALMCILGPLSLPIGPVPISFTNLVIYLTAYVLDRKRCTLATLLYLLIGLVGLPVFSGFTGGPEKLLGPTGGYLIGFFFLAAALGPMIDRFWNNKVISIIAMEACTWIPYLLGTAWLAYSAHMTFGAALAAGVIPFIIEDVIKIVIAAFIGPVLKTRLARYTDLSVEAA